MMLQIFQNAFGIEQYKHYSEHQLCNINVLATQQ